MTRRKGPEWTVDALWCDHGAAVVRYARRRVLPCDVEEVVAETFVVAWRRIEDVPQYPLPWLLGVARGVSSNVRRAARRRDALHDRLSANAPAMPSMSGPEVADDGLRSTLAALRRLREDDRELLTLLAWDGLSREQVAAAIGCTRGALAVRLYRARRRLTIELENGRANEDQPAASQPAHPTPLTGGQR